MSGGDLIAAPPPLRAGEQLGGPGAAGGEGIESLVPRRAAQGPAANGHGTARPLARLYGALATGGTLDRIPVLKPETNEMATPTSAQGPDAGLLFSTPGGVGLDRKSGV